MAFVIGPPCAGLPGGGDLTDPPLISALPRQPA